MRNGKTKPQTMWALWNYDVVFCVEYSRKRCRDYAITLVDEAEYKRMIRRKAFRITKVSVQEI